MTTVSKKILMLILCMLVICSCASTHSNGRVRSDLTVFEDIHSVSQYLAADIQYKFNEYLLKEAQKEKKEAKKYGESQKIEIIRPAIVVGYFMTLKHDQRNMCCKKLESYLRSDLSIEQAIDCDKLKQIKRYLDMTKTGAFDPDYAIKGVMADARFIISARLDLQINKKLIIIILDCRDTEIGKSAFSSRAALNFDDKDIQEAWNIPAPFCNLDLFPDESPMVRIKETGRGEDEYLAEIAAEVLVNRAFLGKIVKPWMVSYTLLTNREIKESYTLETLQGRVPVEINHQLLEKKQDNDGKWSATVIGEMPKDVLKRYAKNQEKEIIQTQPLPSIQNFINKGE